MKNITRKLSIVLVLSMIITLINVIPVMAIQEIDIVPAKYNENNTPRILANGVGISLTANKFVAYDVNFSEPPSYMTLRLGTSNSNQTTLEIKLDNEILLGKITTDAPDSNWHTKDYTFTFDQKITGKHKLYIKNVKGTCDFQSAKIIINEARDIYPIFSETNAYADISENSYKSEINLLNQLGIYPDGENFSPDLFVTRNDFALSVAGFYPEDYVSVVQAFSDVTKGDEGFEKLNMLYEQGIIETDADGKFNGHKFITLPEACKMVLKVLDLGYTVTGNTDAAYIQAAKRAGLITGAEGSDKSITKEQMTAILYNAITEDYMEISGVGEDYFLYEKNPKTVLERTRDIKYGEGVVASHGYTDIFSPDDVVGFGEVKINGVTYTDETGVAGNYLGFNCVFFFKENKTGNDSIVAIYPSTDVSYIRLTTKDNEITKITEEYIEYIDENNREKELKTNSQTNFIYNGKAIEDNLKKYVTEDTFKGSLLMIDNDGNKRYDTVFIEDYVSVLFGGASEEAIFDKITNANIEIDNKDNVLILKDGSRIRWTDLADGTVIDLYQSQNSIGDKINRAIVSTNEVEGVISQITSDNEIEIADKFYKKYENFTKEIRPGQIVKLMLNNDNEIVDFKQTVELKTGLLLGVSEVYDIGFSGGKLSIKLLDTESNISEFEFNENCTADGVRIKDTKELFEGNEKFKGMKNITLQTPIKYGVSDEGKVVYIDTIEKGAENINDCMTEVTPKGTYYYQLGGLVASSKVKGPLADNINVISIWKCGDEDLYKVESKIDIPTGKTLSASVYCSNHDSMLADIVIWYERVPLNYNEQLVFSDKISKYVDGEEKIALKCYSGTAEVEYDVNKYTYETDENFRKIIDSVEAGDIIQMKLDDNKNIIEARVCFFNDGATTNSAGVSSDASLTNQGGTNVSQGGKVSIGKIEKKENGYFMISRDNAGVKEYDYLHCKSANVIVVDKKGTEVKITNGLGTNDIVKGQVIVACMGIEYNTRTIVVYSDLEL